MIVFIVSQQHGAHRMRIPTADGQASVRTVLRLPCETWFEHRLSAAGVDFQWEDESVRHASLFCGLAVLQPTKVYKGCLTRLAAEERLLHHYFQEPEDSVFLSVKAFAALSAPQDCIGDKKTSAGLLKPRFARDVVASDPGRLQCRTSSGPPQAPQGESRLVRDVLREWGYEGGGFFSSVLLLRISGLPHPTSIV